MCNVAKSKYVRYEFFYISFSFKDPILFRNKFHLLNKISACDQN